MIDVVGALELVEFSRLCLHETHEAVRLDSICRSIEMSGVLKHPPLAVPMQRGDHFLIIDGAHRTMALQRLGYRRIPVQVVTEESFVLGMWEHLVPDGDWVRALQADERLRWEREVWTEERWLAEVVMADGTRWKVYAQELAIDLPGQLALWHEIVESYALRCYVNRQPMGTLAVPASGQVLVRFPGYSFQELERVLESGITLPAGVTRFEIEGRLLHLNIPLEVLQGEQVDAEAWSRLQEEWRRKLRFYNRGVYLCE